MALNLTTPTSATDRELLSMTRIPPIGTELRAEWYEAVKREYKTSEPQPIIKSFGSSADPIGSPLTEKEQLEYAEDAARKAEEAYAEKMEVIQTVNNPPKIDPIEPEPVPKASTNVGLSSPEIFENEPIITTSIPIAEKTVTPSGPDTSQVDPQNETNTPKIAGIIPNGPVGAIIAILILGLLFATIRG